MFWKILTKRIVLLDTLQYFTKSEIIIIIQIYKKYIKNKDRKCVIILYKTRNKQNEMTL